MSWRPALAVALSSWVAGCGGNTAPATKAANTQAVAASPTSKPSAGPPPSAAEALPVPPQEEPALASETGFRPERRWQKDGQQAGVQVIHVTVQHYPPGVAERIIRASLPAFRACYGGGLERDERLAGTVGVRLRLGSDGNVADASSIPDQTSLPDTQVVDCVLAQQRTTILPGPEPGFEIIEYQLLLKLEPVPPWQRDMR